MKVLVLGANGILGHHLFLLLNDIYNIKLLGICGKSAFKSNFYFNNTNNLKYVDLTDTVNLNNTIINFNPDFVINCAVKKNEPKSEGEYFEYIYINSILPHAITILSEKCNFKFINISTDSVLGNNFQNASENNSYNANDFYSATKLIGEIKNSSNVITIRTSIIGHSLLGDNGFIDWAISTKNIVGYKKCYFNGTTALELSKLIINKIVLNSKFQNGIIHIASNKISKFVLLKKLNFIYNLNNNLKSDDSLKTSRILDSIKFNSQYDYLPPDWNNLLIDTKSFYQNKISNYGQHISKL
jgi:dTDP-4-dehydrorhamnose reductase